MLENFVCSDLFGNKIRLLQTFGRVVCSYYFSCIFRDSCYVLVKVCYFCFRMLFKQILFILVN